MAKSFEVDVAGAEEIRAMIRANHRLQTAEERGQRAVELLRRLIEANPIDFAYDCIGCGGGDTGNAHIPDCPYLEARILLGLE